ncbi:tRNA (adenosine(37)-N6)-threonylcarbamoyltransferase complex transferase subunit TsaD [Campylobacter sp. CX2-4080-23]|uniref:tRNA (adenosine(37)-N6)-threonylcarbamoyltransferase complex transferase subunit TsaD n=1 Tax=Campylobacter porcelli TaxID=1660073 RepID=UPI002EAFDA71|nr:tRNA (adenosine(37)-N6)-threonylcarbamoyltransferase complex transferase subunit TsaD [Campylobacter sp. CX2-4080-23]
MILGIESSCDDSSIALMGLNLDLIYHKKITQELEHSKYGGVVPELAARLHTAALPNLIKEIKPYFKDIKAIAVTNSPGLSVSLVSGVSVAKALSIALKLPLIEINHLVGHIYSLFLNSPVRLPLGVLLVSGGHTMVLDINENGDIAVLVATSDDSFGESFDKVAKMMGLGYPGGVAIENLATKSTKDRYKFTIPLKGDSRLEYSFSGLKNQVRIEIEKSLTNGNKDFADIAFGFQRAACEHIIDKLSKICNQRKFSSLGVVGGASANKYLRGRLLEICDKFDMSLLLAPMEFCSDNAVMIARAGVEKYQKGNFINLNDLKISPRSSLSSIYL